MTRRGGGARGGGGGGGGAGHPLFLIHSYGGTVLQLRPLARALSCKRAVYFLRPCGTVRGEEPLRRVEDMAVEYLGAMRSVQPHGPYALAGFSFGGLVALEIAQRLRREGEVVELLAMLDTSADQRFLTWAERLQWRRYLLRFHLRSALQARPERRAYLADVADKMDARLDRLRARLGLPCTRRDEGRWWQSPDLPPALRRVQDAIAEAVDHYRPASYAGRIIFFQAEGADPACPYPASIWRRITQGNVVVHVVPGTHETMVQPPNAAALAAILTRYLQA